MFSVPQESRLSSSKKRSCRILNAFILGTFVAGFCVSAMAQAPAHAKSKVVPVDRDAAGDAPDNPGPLATQSFAGD